jgi:hypothetical protein
MSDLEDSKFAGADDAKATIRAAVRYLLKGATHSERSDIVVDILEIVRKAAYDEPPGQPDPFDPDAPGG